MEWTTSTVSRRTADIDIGHDDDGDVFFDVDHKRVYLTRDEATAMADGLARAVGLARATTQSLAVDPMDYAHKDLLLLGFDPGVALDDLLAAAGRTTDGAEVEGVLGIVVGGRREDWVLTVDPSDGYRSFQGPVTRTRVPISSAIMQLVHRPVAVRLAALPDPIEEGWRLVDGGGHVWLEVGTRDFDDYYPMGFVRWTPKEG